MMCCVRHYNLLPGILKGIAVAIKKAATPVHPNGVSNFVWFHWQAQPQGYCLAFDIDELTIKDWNSERHRDQKQRPEGVFQVELTQSAFLPGWPLYRPSLPAMRLRDCPIIRFCLECLSSNPSQGNGPGLPISTRTSSPSRLVKSSLIQASVTEAHAPQSQSEFPYHGSDPLPKLKPWNRSPQN
jgi:hypothetical protein